MAIPSPGTDRQLRRSVCLCVRDDPANVRSVLHTTDRERSQLLAVFVPTERLPAFAEVVEPCAVRTGLGGRPGKNPWWSRSGSASSTACRRAFGWMPAKGSETASRQRTRMRDSARPSRREHESSSCGRTIARRTESLAASSLLTEPRTLDTASTSLAAATIAA
jgi:hypothetical protein